MRSLPRLRFNDPAPDVELLDIESRPVRFSTLWKKTALILAFSRHFGCPQCKQMGALLASIAPEIEANGLQPVMITQGVPRQAKTFCSRHAPGVLCLSDAERISYRAYGLERASLWQTFLSPRVWRSNLQLRRQKGWRTELPPKGQDAMQLGGIFVVGRDGRIHLPYYYDDIADHPPIDLLLHGVMGVDWKKPLEKPLIPNHPPAGLKTHR